MYKLVVISGPNRGSSYVVKEGELSIGRQSGNSVVLPSSKVSKRHCVIVLTGREVVIKDQGSSNGTFVNGALTKLRKIMPGDRISVGEYVLELVEPVKRVVQSAPAVAGFGNVVQLPEFGNLAAPTGGVGNLANIGTASPAASNQPPKDLKGKIIWHFENEFMPIFYGLNFKHEWKIICLLMFSIFVLGNLIISVYPLMESSRISLVKETGRRAKFMARQIADLNAPYLAARAETKTDIGSIETAEGVRVALLTDLDNRILAPGSKLNQYLASGGEALYAVKARDLFRNGRETGIVGELENMVVAVEPVKVMSPTVGRNVIVAMAIVSIDTTLTTPDLGEMGMVYAETLILTGLLGGIILLILYRVTLKPFQVLNEDMDRALKGELGQVTHQYRFEELNSLWDIINSAIQRIPKSDASNSMGSASTLDASALVEEFSGPLRMIGNIVKFGFLVLDANRKIVYMNSMFEEISGIRLDSSIGQEISAVARDQSMGAFTNDILGRVPVGGEGLSEDYDFSGITYKMVVGAFGSPGNSAKCYVMAAVRAET